MKQASEYQERGVTNFINSSQSPQLLSLFTVIYYRARQKTTASGNLELQSLLFHF